MKVRVKFEKHGAVRYIGHLDVMRFFQKTIRRAEIDIAYSQGFSPHQIMTFAQPLGVGLESNGEYMDIEVNSLVSCEDLKNRINQASVPGIQVKSVKVLPDDAGNAMASIAAAEYTVSFKEGRKPEVDLAEATCKFLSQETITITKQTKKGTREVDLKPGIYELSWENDAFHMLLDASSGGNIKPIQVIEAMLSLYDAKLMENALIVTREDVYTNLGTEGEKKFVSLGEIGTYE